MPFATLATPSRRFAVVALAVGATLAGLLPAHSAVAAPDKSSTAAAAATAQAKLDQLGVQADKAVEAFNTAQTKLDAVTAALKAQQAAVAKAKQQVSKAKSGIQALAVAEYEAGTASSSLTVLLSDDQGTALRKADLLAQVNRAQMASLTKMVNADRELQASQTRADQALAAQRAAAAQLAAKKAAVEKALQAQQKVAASLEAKLKQEQAAAAAAARAEQLRQAAASRSQARSNISTQPSTSSAPPSPVHGSGGAAAALRYAYAQLGKPYRWGGAGPSSFDCSGLTMRAWGAAGVSLSHSAAAQQHQGRRVSLSALQPGDLVFWGNPAYHVGIYVGGGRVLDAPHTGTVVKIQSIWGHPSGAVRP